MLFHVSLVVALVAVLPPTHVTLELSDPGVDGHVTAQVWRRRETFAANLAPVRVVPPMYALVHAQTVCARIGPRTLRTPVFMSCWHRVWHTRYSALQRQTHIRLTAGNHSAYNAPTSK